MKRTLIMAFLPIMFVSYSVLALPAQEVAAREPQLHTRPQPPNEKLLPASSIAPFVVSEPQKYPQKYAAVYMPVSLAAGRVRTPEFVAKRSQWYDIMLQIEKSLPFDRMVCMMGLGSDFLDEKNCEKGDPIVQTEWTVWENGQIVQWGSLPDHRDHRGGEFSEKHISMQIGSFPLEAGKKYVVQVHFTKDGSHLNVANPHLIVIPHDDMW